MSSNRRSKSNFLQEPFPDEPEVFQPFDQHRLPLPTIKDSLKLNKKILQTVNEEKKGEEKEDLENDPARVSRLFYLQLYSSVLNSTEPQNQPKQQSKAQKLISSVTNTLKRKSSKNDNSSEIVHPQLQRTLSQDFEQDNEESLHETVIVETIVPESLPSESFTREDLNMDTNTIPVPVLNTRMKNLSQFSFRYRDNEALPTLQKLPPRSSKTICAATRKTIFQSTFLSAFLVISILVFALVLSSPFSITSFYEMVYLPDARPSNRPNLAFCLPMPFDAEKLRQFGLSNELASFLLYTLSPYYPNADVLDKPEMLTDLTRQYRNFVGRVSRKSKSEEFSLSEILYSVAPTCSDLIAGCQLGSGDIIRGSECCALIFQEKLVFSPDGLCLVGGGKQLALVSSEPRFPIVPRPFTIAKLTIVLNMTSHMPIDHRVVPWDPANSDVMTGSVIEENKKPAFRDTQHDFVIRPGHSISVMAKKRQILRSQSRLLPGNQCQIRADYAACKSSIVQKIAEKSVNCSLISLPVTNSELPFCGPLEGLALMYILREQGAFVTINSTMLHRFESKLTENCPSACEHQYFRPQITSDFVIDYRTAETFGAFRPQDIAILEMRYTSEEMIETLREKHVLLTLVEKLAFVSAPLSTLLLFTLWAAKLCKRRSRHNLFE